MKILIFSLIVTLSFSVVAQNLDISDTPNPANHTRKEALKMDAMLYRISAMANESGRNNRLWQEIKALQYFENEGNILITIKNEKGEEPLLPDIVQASGGRITTVFKNMMDVWIRPENVISLARSLPVGFQIESNSAITNDFEGPLPTVTNSQSYKNGGADGSGKRVAIIDNGYSTMNYSAWNSYGTVFDTIDMSGVGFSSGTGTHGQACIGRVWDHAPGARYFIYHAPGSSQKAVAYADAIAKDVDVISFSQSRQNTGWDDDSGDWCDMANSAAEEGILVFCSSGNRAQQHWEGFLKDTDGDDWHEWAGGLNELNTIPLNASNSGSPGSISVWLQWDWNNSFDDDAFELYIYRSVGNSWVQVASDGGNNSNDKNRAVSFVQPDSSVTESMAIAVRHIGPTSPKFEIVVAGSGIGVFEDMAVFHAQGSTTSPSNSTHPFVISVGGVDQSLYFNNSGASGIIVAYSSQGPTNNGNLAPRITGPVNTGGFQGTSCSTPESAGVTLAFWSSVPTWIADAVKYTMYEKANIFKDWGSDGFDNVYGLGGIYLYDYAPGTVWVDNRYPNIFGFGLGPYNYLSHATSNVPNNGRMMFIGQSYPSSYTIEAPKTFIMKSIGYDAYVGN